MKPNNKSLFDCIVNEKSNQTINQRLRRPVEEATPRWGMCVSCDSFIFGWSNRGAGANVPIGPLRGPTCSLAVEGRPRREPNHSAGRYVPGRNDPLTHLSCNARGRTVTTLRLPKCRRTIEW